MVSEYTLSIVIPAYNYAHTLPRAIGSIASQTSIPDEVIVIDDGSRDNTAEVIHSLSLEYPQLGIRYIHQENQGQSQARNHGIDLATSDYVMLLDADDELLPEAIQLLMNKANSDHVDLVIGGSIAVSDNHVEKLRKPERFTMDKQENFRRFLEKESGITHGGFVVKKSLFGSIRYPENLRGAEDLVVFGHFFALCDLATVDEPVLKKHHHDGSVRHNVKHAIDSGLQVVDQLFSAPLPIELMEYQKQFYTRRCLSLFRTIYLAGDYVTARQFYILAVKNDWKALFDWSYLKKFIRSLFK